MRIKIKIKRKAKGKAKAKAMFNRPSLFFKIVVIHRSPHLFEVIGGAAFFAFGTPRKIFMAMCLRTPKFSAAFPVLILLLK